MINSIISFISLAILIISVCELSLVLFQKYNWNNGYCSETGMPWVKDNKPFGIIFKYQKYFGGYNSKKLPIFYYGIIPFFHKDM